MTHEAKCDVTSIPRARGPPGICAGHGCTGPVLGPRAEVGWGVVVWPACGRNLNGRGPGKATVVGPGQPLVHRLLNNAPGPEIVYFWATTFGLSGPLLPKTEWKRGRSPPPFPMGVCGKREPLRPNKFANSGPEALGNLM